MDRSALLLRLKAEIAVEKLTVAEKQSPLLRKGLFAYIRLAEGVSAKKPVSVHQIEGWQKPVPLSVPPTQSDKPGN
jgi:hypothetical protein